MHSTDGKRHLFTLTTGWFCYLLAAVIIAARAFQPNAQPMRDWSWWSWILMCLPVLMPYVVFIAWFSLYALLSAVGALLSAAYGALKFCRILK